MGELEAARSRLDAQVKADLLEKELFQRDLEALMPELRTLETAFWNEAIPPRLLTLFQEVRHEIEAKEGGGLDETRAFIYGEPIKDSDEIDYSFAQHGRGSELPKHFDTVCPSGAQKVEWEPEAGYGPDTPTQLVSLWKNGDLQSLRIKSVALWYSNFYSNEPSERRLINVGFTIPVRRKYSGHISEIGWYAGDGIFERFSGEITGYCSISDEGVGEIAENLVRVVDRRFYICQRAKLVKSQNPHPRASGDLSSTAGSQVREEDISFAHSQGRTDIDLVRRMHEDDELRSRVLDELARQVRDDPTMILPDGVSREELNAHIARRRNEGGLPPRTLDSKYFGNQEGFREDFGRAFPSGDHASGADRE